MVWKLLYFLLYIFYLDNETHHSLWTSWRRRSAGTKGIYTKYFVSQTRNILPQSRMKYFASHAWNTLSVMHEILRQPRTKYFASHARSTLSVTHEILCQPRTEYFASHTWNTLPATYINHVFKFYNYVTP